MKVFPIRCMAFVGGLIFLNTVAAGPITTDYSTTSYLVKSYQGWAVTSIGGNTDNVGYSSSAGYSGNVKITPNSPTDLAIPTADSPVMKLLKQRYPTWTFKSATTNLADKSFVMKTYSAYAPDLSSIGAQIHVLYDENAGANNPKADTTKTNIHWIQMFSTNHKNGAAHGVPDTSIDAGVSPYYDGDASADAGQFFDWSKRPDPQNPHNWDAQLFLAVGPPPNTPGEVTLYNGIGWGWSNTVKSPEPSTILLSCVGLAGVGVRWLRRRGRRQANRPGDECLS